MTLPPRREVPYLLVIELDAETEARWQLAADRFGWTVEEWLRDVASTASDPDAGEVVQVAETTHAIGRIRAFLSMDAFGRTIVQSEALDAVAELEVAWRAVEAERDDWKRRALADERDWWAQVEVLTAERDAALSMGASNLSMMEAYRVEAMGAEARVEALEAIPAILGRARTWLVGPDGAEIHLAPDDAAALDAALASAVPQPPVPEQERNNE